MKGPVQTVRKSIDNQEFNLEAGPVKVNSSGLVSLIFAILIGVAVIAYAISNKSTHHWRKLKGKLKRK